MTGALVTEVENAGAVPTVLVVAVALIDPDGRILIAQRPEGKQLAGLWEFPGGKIEPGESADAALKREIQEELGVDISINEFLCTTDYDYPSFHLTMHCYLCRVELGMIELREHKSARWLTVDMLDSVEWLPADWEVVENIK